MFGFGKRKPADPLDRPLYRWNDCGDLLTRRDLLRSMCVIGASGSGKSSGPGKELLKALMADPMVSVVLITSKPEERPQLEKLAEKFGRRQDLLIMDDSCALRFNPMQHEVESGADTAELTRCLMTVAESLQRGSGQGGGDRDPFFHTANGVMLHQGIEVVKGATSQVDPAALQEFILGAARVPEQVKAEEWKKGAHNLMLQQAYCNARTPRQQHDFKQAWQYWVQHIPGLNERTRSSIEAGVLNILAVFNRGIVRDLLCADTNVSPAYLDRGKWWVVDMPTPTHGASGQFVAGSVKYAVQRHVLRRHAGPGTPLTILVIDEFQNHMTTFDAHYLAEARSHRGGMCVLTQSVNSFTSEMPGRTGKEHAFALLSNLGAKLFLTAGDDQTAEFASKLVGKRLETFIGGSMAPEEEPWDTLMGRGKFTGSFSTHYENILQPAVFLSGLRCGGPANGYLVDGILIRNGDPFANGEAWIPVTFDQRG